MMRGTQLYVDFTDDTLFAQKIGELERLLGSRGKTGPKALLPSSLSSPSKPTTAADRVSSGGSLHGHGSLVSSQTDKQTSADATSALLAALQEIQRQNATMARKIDALQEQVRARLGHVSLHLQDSLQATTGGDGGRRGVGARRLAAITTCVLNIPWLCRRLRTPVSAAGCGTHARAARAWSRWRPWGLAVLQKDSACYTLGSSGG